MADQLIIRGAREHNLKDVSLDLPRDSLIVFTGLSGSGKSSLAFDTIFAEGQRRYVESLSAYARQFLGQMDKPDVDFIEGLSPAVSIDQKSTSKNPRSTVGTITEVYDYLRLLYARAGRPHCPTCGEPISRQTPQQIVDRVMQLEEGTRFQVLAPVVRGRKGEYVDLFRQLQTQGFSRARVDGETHLLTEPPTLDKQKKHTIEVVVDRLAAKPSAKRRLTDSVETALGLAGGLVVVDLVDLPDGDPGREHRYSERMACPNEHPIDTDELEPRSFSFNSPFGACPECHGLGTRMEVDPELVVTDPSGTLADGIISPWSGAHVSDFFQRLLGALGQELGFDLDTPWERLPAKARKSILDGHATKVHVRHRNRYGRERSYHTAFEGVRPYIERRHREAESDTSRERFEGFMREVPCPTCDGSRLKPVSVAVTIGGLNIAEVCAMSIDETAQFLRTVELSNRERQIAERVLKEIQERLNFLLDVGLDYLSLNRPAGSLSGGEAQRIRLATQIGAGLVGRPLRPRRAVDRAAPAGQPPADRDAGPPSRPRQHADRRRARRGHHPDGRLGRGHRPRCGGARRPGGPLGTGRRPAEPPRLGDRPLPLRTQGDPAARRTPAADRGARAARRRGQGAQPPRHRRLVPARHVRRGDRGERVGQVDAGQRHPLHLARQADLQRAGPSRDATGASRGSTTSTR